MLGTAHDQCTAIFNSGTSRVIFWRGTCLSCSLGSILAQRSALSALRNGFQGLDGMRSGVRRLGQGESCGLPALTRPLSNCCLQTPDLPGSASLSLSPAHPKAGTPFAAMTQWQPGLSSRPLLCACPLPLPQHDLLLSAFDLTLKWARTATSESSKEHAGFSC